MLWRTSFRALKSKQILTGSKMTWPSRFKLSPFVSVQVYDGTGFLKDHPGGAESILLAAGMDSSDDFNAIHSAKAKKMVEEYYIGEFDENAPSKYVRLTLRHIC